jgi:hypothetical protein
MTIALKANGDGSAEIQVNGVTRIAISAAGVVTFPDTPNTQLGIGQTWQDLTASRAIGNSYTNSTSKPITIKVTGVNPSAYNFVFTIDGLVITGIGAGGATTSSDTVVVPPGATYSVSGITSLTKWYELRA